jgi:hypothetical protein
MRPTTLCVSILFASAILAVISTSAFAETLDIEWTDRGWYNESVFHDPNNTNYGVGDGRSSFCRASCFDDFRNFFVFDLSGVTQPIGSAKLALSLRAYGSDHDSETYELHDVTTSIATLRNGTGGVTPHSDLGSGSVYGGREITPADAFTEVEIMLNSSAIAALNSNHGLFAIGGSLTTLDGIANQETLFGATGSSIDISQLRLTFVPEPSTLFLLAIGATSLLGLRRFRLHS